MGYVLENSGYGTKMVLAGSWEDGYVDTVRTCHVSDLELNYARGWKRSDLSFLQALIGLEAIRIVDRLLDDISPLHSLVNLHFMSIHTYCRTHLDFSCFPKLEKCFLEWRRGAESVFECLSLKWLYLNCFKGKDSHAFTKLVNLERLIIGNGPLPDVRGLAALSNLRHLALYNLRNLSSLEGIEQLSSLRHLEVRGCRRIRNIDLVTQMSGLEVLDISNCGEIESLRPITGLPNLVHVDFIQDTNILDGDLSPLLTLPKLGDLGFRNRRHYSHKRQDFPQCLHPLRRDVEPWP
jgi:hypothetical protein